MRELGAGVAVRPTMRVTSGRTFRIALNRCAWWDLNEDNSSMTTISKSQCRFFTSHVTFSRLMIYRKAGVFRAERRSCSLPSTFTAVRPARCSHFSISCTHTFSATRLGAMTSTRPMSKESSTKSHSAVKVMTVLPRPQSSIKQLMGCSSRKRVA